jgi:uncharacterized protein (DUF2141 family)
MTCRFSFSYPKSATPKLILKIEDIAVKQGKIVIKVNRKNN